MSTVRSVFRAADEMRDLAGGDVVFSEGDEGHEMFGVVSGSVTLYKGQNAVSTIGTPRMSSGMSSGAKKK